MMRGLPSRSTRGTKTRLQYGSASSLELKRLPSKIPGWILSKFIKNARESGIKGTPPWAPLTHLGPIRITW